MGKTRVAIPGFKGRDLKTSKPKRKSLRKRKGLRKKEII